MNSSGFSKRLTPLLRKLKGELPLCPWASVLSSLDPRTLSAYPPPLQIEEVARSEGPKKLRFNNTHEAWFPEAAEISPEMWNEYLGVFWEHPANSHRYLAHGTFINRGDVCLDCGACEGFFVFQALEAGASKIICIEPDAEMADCLRLTFTAEIEKGIIIVHNVAVGAVDGTAYFSSDHMSPFGGTMKETSGAGHGVAIETIASVCERLEINRVHFIKMDIEGAEIQAVEGALPILRRDHPRLAITTYHRSYHFAVLRSLLRAAGYRNVTPAGNTRRGGKLVRPVMLHAPF